MYGDLCDHLGYAILEARRKGLPDVEYQLSEALARVELAQEFVKVYDVPDERIAPEIRPPIRPTAAGFYRPASLRV